MLTRNVSGPWFCVRRHALLINASSKTPSYIMDAF